MELAITFRAGAVLFSILVLGVLPASSAALVGKTRRPPSHPSTVIADASSRCRGANLFHCGPLYNGNDYLGNDPDPFIRLMIQRDLGAKYGGEP